MYLYLLFCKVFYPFQEVLEGIARFLSNKLFEQTKNSFLNQQCWFLPNVNLIYTPKYPIVKLTHLAQKIWLVRLLVQVEMFCRTFQNGSVIDQIGLGELQLIGWPKPKQGKQQKSKKLTIVKAICGKGNANG